MTAFRDVYEQIFEGDGQLYKLWFNLIFYSLTGLFVGSCTWSTEESKYKDAVLSVAFRHPSTIASNLAKWATHDLDPND